MATISKESHNLNLKIKILFSVEELKICLPSAWFPMSLLDKMWDIFLLELQS